MTYELKWFGRREGESVKFPATVPGDIQRDYAIFREFPDHNFGLNYHSFDTIEDSAWIYSTDFVFEEDSCRCFFVTDGIDYECEIFVNGNQVFSHEGMFEGFEVDITDRLNQGKNTVEVRILPPPKCKSEYRDRAEAAESVKPPASYGWDWHPRLIPSGIWNGARIETRDSDYLGECEVFYDLSDDFSSVKVGYRAVSNSKTTLTLYDAEGNPVGRGDETVIIENPSLWWPRGQGEPYLYFWEIENATEKRSGRVGFRTVSLSMNEGAWDKPDSFPKSRSTPPITLTVNGRKIFAKGTNVVEPDVFTGNVSDGLYERLVKLAYDANMNIFRMWGGAGLQKDIFYNLCDEYGIMVWQEFPLACNLYPDKDSYLEVLRTEAIAIVKKMRQHPSTVLYCGGNELFNVWSGMTEQSHPLRLLNAICYEYDRKTPFIMASPLMGMAHGGYVFNTPGEGEVYEIFGKSSCTAYTEFGVPSFASYEYLKGVIPEEELAFPTDTPAWREHHAFGAWTDDSWGCVEMMKQYFPDIKTTEDCCEKSAWLQSEGYKAIFEEARRQWPACSMAINWCYNEPWKCAANNSILSYPDIPKPAYYAVGNSLRDACPSARLKKFSYRRGEVFTAELWFLNDTPSRVCENVDAYIEIRGERIYIMKWENIVCEPNSNAMGHELRFVLDKKYDAESFELVLVSREHGEARYKLRFLPSESRERGRTMNI